MLDSERDHNVKKTANLSFVLLIMFALVVSAFAYAVLYKLLEGWALRDVLAAIVGVCMILLGIAMSWMFRSLIVQAGQVIHRIERLSETIEEKLLSLPAQPSRVVSGTQSYLAEGTGEVQAERTPEHEAAIDNEPASDEAEAKSSSQDEEKLDTPSTVSAEDEAAPHAAPKKPRQEDGGALHALTGGNQETTPRQDEPMAAIEKNDALSIDVDELPDL